MEVLIRRCWKFGVMLPALRCHYSIATVDFHEETTKQSDLNIVISKVCSATSEEEALKSLMETRVEPSHDIVNKLLSRFKSDWKSALCVFKWASLVSDFEHSSQSYDAMVDILGKMKQMDKMREILGEMRLNHLVTLNTMSKAMRRLAGAGKWEDAAKLFDELDSFGLEKNVESMNVLLDTLCKENKVEQAREIFLELKSYIAPNASTFNIFIHGWCNVSRVDEAHWTIEEMKGHGCRPCVISYSTIIQAYCQQSKFSRVYELLDEMKAEGCPPNVVTFTTIMCSLAKAEEFEEALQLSERMKSMGCKPDTLYYNCLIHILGRAGKVREAAKVFNIEMPKHGVAPNTSTYNTMIALYCRKSQEQNALNVLKEIESSNFCKPDLQTYYPLLKLCFKTGKTDNWMSKLVDDMVNKHHLCLDYSTYTLLIHGLCRANKCEWAYLLFEEMVLKEIMPRYQTCRLLLEELKQKNIYHAADRLEEFMKSIK